MTAVIGKTRTVNLSLNAAVVDQARGLTPNLSETIEALQAGFIAEEQATREDWQSRLAETIRFLNERDETHGVWADEFPI